MITIRNLSSLYEWLRCSDKILIEKLINVGLFKPLGKCNKCRRRRVLHKNKAYKVKFAARCPRCRKSVSLTKGTIFAKSRLSIRRIMEGIFLWSTNDKVASAASMSGINKNKLNILYKYIREVALWKMNQLDGFKVGGPGKVVQVNDTHANLNYPDDKNKQRDSTDHWILTIYDVDDKWTIFKYVENRDAGTLLPIIEKYVIPGTEIWTAERDAYQDLNRMGYIHKTVNHPRVFKDPITGVCINGALGRFRSLKNYLRKHCIKIAFIPGYIGQFKWFRFFAEDPHDSFFNIIDQIKERYKA